MTYKMKHCSSSKTIMNKILMGPTGNSHNQNNNRLSTMTESKIFMKMTRLVLKMQQTTKHS